MVFDIKGTFLDDVDFDDVLKQRENYQNIMRLDDSKVSKPIKLLS